MLGVPVSGSRREWARGRSALAYHRTMGTLLLLAFGGFVVWLVAGSMSNRRLLAEARRRRELATFEIDRSDHPFVDETRFDFERMQAQHHHDVMDEPGMRTLTTYALRRRDGGWEWKMSDVSFRERMKALETLRSSRAAGAERTYLAEKEKYADGPIWEALSDEYAAQVETAYQRYVRQG